jgi:hypothetical protein
MRNLHRFMTVPARRNLFFLGSVVLAGFVALLPWWRNHSYLRDLYDYGLVLAANGHLDLGARPYVDFTTPIQAGYLGLNWLIERWGGGNYRALTLGGAGLIVLSATLLPLLLSRRWPWWVALVVGGVVTIAGASQHTILWHNSLGLFCLALVSWASACAPVGRRASWPWHVLLAAGLFLGGLNKLNFHLVGVAAALAWAVRAGLVRQAGWGRVGATAAAVFLGGVVLPVAVELAWTGASLSLWLANVVHLASASRLEILGQIWSGDFLLKPIHDYYGPVLLPQAGLLGVGLALATLMGCWPHVTPKDGPLRWDRWLVPAGVVLAGFAGAALLATNFEIVSLGLGAWLVLMVSLWLGFAPAMPRIAFLAGVILPAVLIGLSAWWSAWEGQRSQFGFSPAARADYRPAESAGPAFVRLTGLLLPPEVMQSLEVLEQALPDKDDKGVRPVFYGPGLEYLHRYLPGRWQKGQPLWAHWGTSYGPAQIELLGERLARPGLYEAVLATRAFDTWPDSVGRVLRQHYIKGDIGPVFRSWARGDLDSLDLTDGFDALTRLGGNVDGRMLLLDKYPLRPKRTADGLMLFGTAAREGNVLLRTPSRRVRAVAKLVRRPGRGNGPLIADFKAIIHGSIPEDARWSARLELRPGEQSVAVPFEVDAGGKPLMLWVSQPEANRSGAFAGYREMEITHAAESTGGAPHLRPAVLADTPLTAELAASLFGPIGWRPHRLVVRGGRPGDAGLELSAGGEVWLQSDQMTGEVWGRVVRPAGSGPTQVRVVWYKSGRLQRLQEGWVHPGQVFEFHAWTAEPGGWIGLLLDQTEETGSAQVRMIRSTLIP